MAKKLVDYPLLGLHCAMCAGRAETTLQALEGVEEVSVNLASASVQVRYDEQLISPEKMQEAIQEAGYQLVIELDQDDDMEAIEALRQAEYKAEQRKAYLALGLSLPIMLLSMLWMHELWAQCLSWVLTTVVLLVSGRGFFTRAYKQAQGGGLGMDALVALSTGIAYLYSSVLLILYILGQIDAPHLYLEASAMIIAFVLLGKLLEAGAKGGTMQAIKQLMGLQVETARRLRLDGSVEEVKTASLRVGERVLLSPGEMISVDGKIVEGESWIDESSLTGESKPVKRSIGDAVFVGTLNGEGALVLEVQAVGKQTRLSRIIQRVREAQGTKAPIQRTVDKVASIFVPTIVTLSIITLILWLVLGKEDALIHGLQAMITVLVIACPCALGLATPTAIMVGVGRGAREGILIKDAESLELAASVEVIVLDKTGTITEGKPRLQPLQWVRSETPTLRTQLRQLEQRSEHPLAKAIVEALPEEGDHLSLTRVEAIPGKGIQAQTTEGRKIFAGNRAMLSIYGIEPSPSLIQEEERRLSRGESVVYYADEEGIIALLSLADTPKASSREAIAQLQSRGIEVVMLTGDHEAVAKHIAQEVGIKRLYAGVLPEEKADLIRQLRSEGKRVAMVGDGINDSAALAEADVSIAMGQGSDIAIETAMATISSSDLAKLHELILLSQKTMRTIKENLFWAFIYNLIAIPIAAGALYPLWGIQMNPMYASLAMVMSSVSVVLNSLRLRSR